MAVTYLIAAHRDPAALADLVRALRPARVVVHIDAKVPIEPFRHAVADESHVRFVEQRVRVFWAGWSQVEVALRLMTAATGSLEDQDHAVLLSGDAFPLQPQTAVARYLDARPDRQLMSCVPVPVPGADRLVVREFGSMTRLSRVRFEQDRDARVLSVRSILNRLEIRRPYRRALRGKAPHGGGQWWALSGAAVRWLLEEARRDRRFLALCRTSAVPDEFFLPTLLMSSPFAGGVGRSPMYTDWTRDTGWSPASLTLEHVARFARLGLVSSEVQDDDFLDRHARAGLAEERAGGQRTALLFARKVADRAVTRRIEDELWPVDLLPR